MSNLKQKLFYDYAYGVALRRRTDDPSAPFVTTYPTNTQWYADPFLCNEAGKDYLFVELFDYHYGYGQIAVSEIHDNIPTGFKVVIREPFHMSFPNVFKWNGIYYMIPEVYQSNQVRLYRCVDFPNKWELDSVLLQDVKLVDHALLQQGNELLMISYDISEEKRKSRVFCINLNTKITKEIFPTGMICQERAAGTFFGNHGKTYRAIQDCTKCYGDFLRFYQVEQVTREKIEEHEIMNVHAGDIKWNKDSDIEHVHTYNCSKTYEVIDFQYNKFYPNKFIMRFWQKVLLRKRHI